MLRPDGKIADQESAWPGGGRDVSFRTMPVHWTISHPQRLVVAVAKEPVTVADMEQYFAGVTADGGMAYAKIFEITHSPLAISEDNLKALGQRVMFYAQHGQIGPLAIVAASDESYAQAQIFANAATVKRPLQIFRELHAARQWLDAQATPS
ncbi:MAG TPA: hypothetical protein VD858_10775 [Reyranella sp.]|nr:hypothetical protein [Reyranella sp.]